MSQSLRKDELEVMLVEDNPADVDIVKRLFKENNIDEMITFSSGDQAYDFLFDSNLSEESIPDLLLLDLNLPGMDGRSLLVKILEHDKLCSLPVIILTTSESTEDIEYCYRNGANSYFVKPSGKDRFRKIISTIVDYWLNMVTLPRFRDHE